MVMTLIKAQSLGSEPGLSHNPDVMSRCSSYALKKDLNFKNFLLSIEGK